MKQGWEIRPFEKCIEKVKYTTKIATCDYSTMGAYPVVSQEKEYISGYWNNAEDVFRVSKPVVIFGDHTRVLKYVDFDFVLGADGVKILQPIDAINAKFFLYYLIASKIPSLGYSRHYKLLKELNVPVPPIAEQEKIVAELDCLSGIIEKKKQQLKELDNLAQSIFYEMFGDPVENDKGWEVKTYGSEFQISSGGTPDTKNNLYWDNGDISWIGSNLCHDEIIYKNDGKYITKDGFDNSSAKEYKSGYVLVALVGATIGRTALLRFNTTTNQNVAGINVPANDNFVPEFIFYHLQKLYELFMGIGNGKFKMANLRFIRELPLIVPSLSLQQEFASKIESIEKQKELIAQSIKETETLFNSRMDYYFN